jgi:hypothetical protein
MSDARKWTFDEVWHVVDLAAREGLLPDLASHNFYCNGGEARSMAPAGTSEIYTDRLRAQLVDLFQGQLLVRINGPVWPATRQGANFYDPFSKEWVLPSMLARVMHVR